MGRRLAEALGASLVAALLGTGTPAAAAAPASETGPPSGGCSRPFDDARVRCLFDATGAPETWVVPDDVSFLLVHAWGAQGASISVPDGGGVAGGRGRGVFAGVDVRGGETLTITVGTRGSPPEGGTGTAPGGFGGGGAGGRSGGGGGGATTVSDVSGRWVVAGGGGGAGLVKQHRDAIGRNAGSTHRAGAPQREDQFVSTQTQPGSRQSGARRRHTTTCAAVPAVASAPAPIGRRGRALGHAGAGGAGVAGGGGGGWVGGGAGRAGASCDPVAVAGAAGSNGIRTNRPAFALVDDPRGKAGDGRVSLEYYAYDPDGAPTVVVHRLVGPRESGDAAPVRISAVFSEPVTGFTSQDLRIRGTDPSTLEVVVTEAPPLDGTTYDIAVGGAGERGTGTLWVPAGSATDHDHSTNAASTLVSLRAPGQAAGTHPRPGPRRHA